MPALIDIQAIQSPTSWERGISRCVRELTLVLNERRPDLVSAFVLNPGLPIEERLTSLGATGKLVRQDLLDVERSRPFLYHVTSPFEPAPIDLIWPRAARCARSPLVVTHYDVIPLLYRELYLRDTWARLAYRTRLELVTHADRVLVLSETSARDVEAHLGVPRSRIRVIGAGVSGCFVRPRNRDAALEEARAALPWLEPEFLLLTGVGDPRKGADVLIEAYGSLRASLRGAHQLVLVGRVWESERQRLESLVADLNLRDRVRVTGLVDDALLVHLYQACGLFIFPSLYEGFGLPVAEALSCGAPVLVADTPALRELLSDPVAAFDPRDPRSVRLSIETALTDRETMARLRSSEPRPSWSWSAVADRVAAAYSELLDV